ncbi:MAG: excalibur calcium-binding domain-containing protein [Rhodobacterales bacterium]|nr:excalibur calcium-binding domain-containing protein [Rhodobacterales bacterium]
MRNLVLAAALSIFSVSLVAAEPEAEPQSPTEMLQQLVVASSWSCSPRLTCKKIPSCEEAVWLLQNCSWGGALDRDNDGVPCETICPGG